MMVCVRRRLDDADPLTSLTAAWILAPQDRTEAMRVFQRWLLHPSKEIQRTAAGILAATGCYGCAQMQAIMRNHGDGYVRANVAMGLLGLREDLPQACLTLTEALRDIPERWMWREMGIFRILFPSDVKQKEGTPNYPEMMNQITRLEILNALAMVKSPTALPAMKQFLQERTWGVAGIAASLLLAEGDESTFALVRELQKDPVRRVRAQAALVLALWGHDPESVDALQNIYAEADFTLKSLILEALGNVGHEKSIPFLIARLEEPSEQMRLIAATSLIRCLNH
jgi:HEAT repeat protein